MEMFGSSLLAHDRRYDLAAEWLSIIKRLWMEEEEFDFEGEFFNLQNLICRPRPLQRPYPVIMSTGASERGRLFAAKYADIGFSGPHGQDLDDLNVLVNEYHRLARDKFERDLMVWTTAFIYYGETEKEAVVLYDYVVLEKGDWRGANNLATTLGLDRGLNNLDDILKRKEQFIAGWGGYPLIGTKEQIVDALKDLSNAGFDKVLLSWPRYINDMRRFKEAVYPLIIHAGLR